MVRATNSIETSPSFEQAESGFISRKLVAVVAILVLVFAGMITTALTASAHYCSHSSHWHYHDPSHDDYYHYHYHYQETDGSHRHLWHNHTHSYYLTKNCTGHVG